MAATEEEIAEFRRIHAGPDGSWPPPAKADAVRGGGNGRHCMCQFGPCGDDGEVSHAVFGVLVGVVGKKVLGLKDACGACVERHGLSNRIDLTRVTPDQCAAAIYTGIKKNAKKKGEVFEEKMLMTRAEFIAFVKAGTHCAATGFPFTLTEDNHAKVGSIDRIDSNLPYVTGNIMHVRKHVNSTKGDVSPGALIQRCKEIVYARASAGAEGALPTARLGGDNNDVLVTSNNTEVSASAVQDDVLLVTASHFNAHKNTTKSSKKRRHQKFWPRLTTTPMKKERYYDETIGGRIGTLAPDAPLPPVSCGYWCGRLMTGIRSLDRLDNALGYGNDGQTHLFCCSDCNGMRGELSAADFERLCAAIAANEDNYMAKVDSARATYKPTAAMPSLPQLDNTHTSFHPMSKDDAGVRNLRGMLLAAYEWPTRAPVIPGSLNWRSLARRAGVSPGSRAQATDKIRALVARPAGWRFVFACAPDPVAAAASRTLPTLPA